MYKVNFKDVGSMKRNWSKSFSVRPDEYAIANEAKKSGALLSRIIDAEFGTNTTGVILAGFRTVGTFSISVL